jgi:hypothetical protein
MVNEFNAKKKSLPFGGEGSQEIPPPPIPMKSPMGFFSALKSLKNNSSEAYHYIPRKDVLSPTSTLPPPPKSEWVSQQPVFKQVGHDRILNIIKSSMQEPWAEVPEFQKHIVPKMDQIPKVPEQIAPPPEPIHETPINFRKFEETLESLLQEIGNVKSNIAGIRKKIDLIDWRVAYLSSQIKKLLDKRN